MNSKRSWNQLNPPQKGALAVTGLIQVLLLLAALIDLRRRPSAQVRGNKRVWTLVVFINFVGPLAYFLLGRKRSGGSD